jgi:hypothetical protein
MEIALWCRELGLLLQQNVPILKALDVVAQDCASYRLFEFTLALREAVRDGEALSDWACLPPLTGYAADVIKAGEQSGSLAGALTGLAEVFERRGRLGIGERRSEPPEKPTAQSSEEEMTHIFLSLPGQAREAEKLLSTRIAGVEAAEFANDSPIVRLANVIIAHAIQETATHIFFVSNGGVSVEFGDTEDERRQVMTIPTWARDSTMRRLKLLADIPYWKKPPATGFITVSYRGEPYRLVLWSESQDDDHEMLRVDILQAGSTAGAE